MSRFLLDEVDGVKEWLVFDDAADTFHIHRQCDVEPVLNDNKRLQSLNDGYTPSRDMKRVASIPLEVVALWKQIYGADPTERGNEALLDRLLASNEWRHLRTDGKPSRLFWTSPTTAKEIPLQPPGAAILGA